MAPILIQIGYTGKLTVKEIAKTLPTNLKWAVAGRSRNKLDALVAQCRSANPDRSQPGTRPMFSLSRDATR